MSEVRVCSVFHKTAPMISTLAFRGAEFWCPICSRLEEMFGGRTVPATPELIALEKAYRERAEPYLKYRASLAGGMVENDEGKLVPLVVERVEYEYENPISLKENAPKEKD